MTMQKLREEIKGLKKEQRGFQKSGPTWRLLQAKQAHLKDRERIERLIDKIQVKSRARHGTRCWELDELKKQIGGEDGK